MNKLIYKCKNDKLFMIVCVLVSFVILFDLFMVVFDIIQFVKLTQNSVNLFNGFIALNVIAGVFNIFAGLAGFVYFMLNRRRIKTDNKLTRK